MTSIQIQALITVVTPFILQLAKNSQAHALDWIDRNRPRVSVAINFLAALATNAGVAVHHSPGQFVVSYSGLPAAVQGLTGFAVMTGVQFLASHSVYHSLVKYVLPGRTPNALTKV